MTEKEIFMLLKMSIFQFLMKNGFCFCNKERGVLFDLLSNDKKINIENGIVITENNNIIIISWFSIKKDFLSNEKLNYIVNYMNEISEGIFSYFIQDNIEKDYIHFNLKTFLPLFPGVLIDDDFWRNQISIQINNISIITNFLFSLYPESKFYKNENELEFFKKFFSEKINDYIKALSLLKKEEEKLKKDKKIYDYNLWTEEEIYEEIDKELEIYKKDKNNVSKLNLLVLALENKNKN